ncbi:MAG: putative metal-binding motif-containing protein [Myxococcaceae bacterium]|nr:putative metal-binding motif-containing protein [Myxococcaceae bacterium]
MNRIACSLLVVSTFACVTREAPPSQLAEGCLLNSDCAEKLVCVFRRCHVTCASDRDCPAASRCQITDNPYAVCLLDDENSCTNKACPPGLQCGPDFRCRRDCLTHRDCLEEQTCIEGQCVSPQDRTDAGLTPTSVLCAFDSDCAAESTRQGVYLECGPNKRCQPQCLESRNCRLGEACVAGRCLASAVDAGVACAYDSQCQPWRCRAGQCAPECQSGVDCGPLRACVQGACVASDGGLGEWCAVATDCANGLVCRSGLCVRECASAAECPLRQVCTPQGRCAAQDGGVGAGCLLSSDCQGTLLCRQGACLPECVEARDCAADQACSQSRCVAAVSDGGAGASCQLNSDCGPGLACLQGRCAVECRVGADCSPGLVCELGRCRLPVGDGGTSSGDGGVGCVFNSQCATGRCFQGQCVAECLATSDCTAPRGCDAGRCVLPPGVTACQRTSECDAGQACSPQGQCIAECATARDCAPGLDCAGGRCVFPGGNPDGGPPGFGQTCALQSSCAPFGLVCGVSGRCIFQCALDSDCQTSAGFCCRSNQCIAGLACVPDGGSSGFDAGQLPDGGCRADNDCLDNDYCNGNERCILGACTSGRNPCDDENPCTIDSCSNALRTCTYQSQAIDADNDQHFPLACGGSADDCDDNDGTTFPGALERCDWKDNNCNGGVDEGLWVEEPGARGSVTSSGAYPARAGAPAAVRLGSEVLVTAASFGVTGRHELFKLSAADLSFVTGPVPVSGAATTWTTCSTFNGRQVVRPGLVTNGTVALAHGLAQSFANPALYCCNSNNGANPFDRRSQRNFGTLVTPATLATTGSAFVAFDDAFGSGANYCGGISDNFQQPRMTAVRAAWSSSLSAFVGTWFEQPDPSQSLDNTTSTQLKFGTLLLDGGVTTARFVWAGLGSDAAYKPASGNGQTSNLARVAVGATTVLFVWTNREVPPLNETRVRYVLYDAALTSVVAGPFELNLTGGLQRIDWVEFDGTFYRLVGTGNISAPEERTRLITVTEAGAVVSTRYFGLASPSSQAGAYHSNTQSSSALVGPQWKGFVHSIVQDQRLRFFYGPSAPDAGAFQSIDLTIGGDPALRSDFTLVPLSDTRVGVLWVDDNLRRTVMRCGP